MSTIENNFYVDDCWKSLETEQNAVDLMKDLTRVQGRRTAGESEAVLGGPKAERGPWEV